MFVHMRELDEAFSKLPEVCRFQLVLKLVDQRDRIAQVSETDAGVDRKALSEAINKRCQDVFKLRMDEINYLSKGASAPGREEGCGQPMVTAAAGSTHRGQSMETSSGDRTIAKLLVANREKWGKRVWMRKKDLGLLEGVHLGGGLRAGQELRAGAGESRLSAGRCHGRHRRQ